MSFADKRLAAVAERARARASEGRTYQEAKARAETPPAANEEPRPSECPARWHWEVNLPDRVQLVVMDEPATQAQVRARFPDSVGAVPW